MKALSPIRQSLSVLAITALACSLPTAVHAQPLDGHTSPAITGNDDTVAGSTRASADEINRAKNAAADDTRSTAGSGSAAVADDSVLWEGRSLQNGEALYSDNYQHKVELDDDGVLRKFYLKWWFLWVEDWSVDALGAESVQMRSNGNLAAVTAHGEVVWSSGTGTKPNRQRASALLQNDGNFVVRHGKKIVWDSNGTVIPEDPENPDTPETSNKLQVGEKLVRGQSLTSKNGKFVFTFQKDGNLVTTKVKSGKVTWASGTAGRQKANRLVVQKDGNVVLYSKKNKAFWSTQTVADSPRNPRLVLKNSGELVVKHGKSVVWSSKNTPVTHGHVIKAGTSLRAGDKMISKNKKFQFVFQKDGNLVTYSIKTNKAVWNSQTAGETDAQKLTLENDGMLVLRSKHGDVIWVSESDSASGEHDIVLKLTQKGKLKIKDGKETLWKSH